MAEFRTIVEEALKLLNQGVEMREILWGKVEELKTGSAQKRRISKALGELGEVVFGFHAEAVADLSRGRA